MKPMCSTAQALSMSVWRRKICGNYVVNADTGCWEWTAAIDRYGYGGVVAKVGGRKRYTGAHRASWIANRGVIPDGLHIDHLCRNRRCVNPDHLEPVTQAENYHRGENVAPGSYGDLPLDERPGCSRHGKADGRWFSRKRKSGNRVPRWDCRLCRRERRQREKAKREAGSPSAATSDEP